MLAENPKQLLPNIFLSRVGGLSVCLTNKQMYLIVLFKTLSDEVMEKNRNQTYKNLSLYCMSFHCNVIFSEICMVKVKNKASLFILLKYISDYSELGTKLNFYITLDCRWISICKSYEKKIQYMLLFSVEAAT